MTSTPSSLDACVLIQRVLAAFEALSTAQFVELLSPDAIFIMGSAPPVKGREEIQRSLAGVFLLLRGVRRHLVRFWQCDDGLAFQGEATFHFLDGQDLSLPHMDMIVRGKDGLISEYRTFIDLTPLH